MGIVDMQRYKKNNFEDIKKEIFSFLLKIPNGKIVTYKMLGDIFHLHPRVIGKILASNKHPEIYPCYKVVKSDSSLGGYNIGIKEKIRKLKKEGIEVDEKKRRIKNLKNYLYFA